MSFYINRDAEADAQEGVDAFDAEYFRLFGRYPAESPMAQRPPDARRAAIQNLITGGATEGERSAAQAAMERLDAAAHSHAANMGRLDGEAESFGSYD